MANPKYIELPDDEEDKKDDTKKVTKKAYSFRCDESLLADMNKYAEIEGITLPQLLTSIMADFLHGKVLSNDYLEGVEGKYINIPSNVKDNVVFEYEIRYVANNLDIWDGGYISKRRYHGRNGILHEGIDFLVIPETLHINKLSEVEKVGLHVDYSLNLNNIPSCLYCIYLTVDNAYRVEYEVISWIDAMNKLKEADRYDLISYGNEIKKKLEALHNDYIRDEGMYDVEMMWDAAYGRLLRIAKDYNTGAILPAESSIDNIEYTPIVKKLPDDYQLVNKLMRENHRLKSKLSDIDKVLERLDDLESRRKEWDNIPDNTPES